MSPKIAQTVYGIGTIIPVILSIFLVWGGIDANKVDGINDIVTGLLVLLGAGPPALATARVAKQRKDGHFDVVAPADQAINGVQAVLEAKNQAVAEVERVKQAVGDAVANVPVLSPVLSPLAQQFINSLPV